MHICSTSSLFNHLPLTTVTVAITNKRNVTSVGECEGKGPSFIADGNKWVQSLWKTVWRSLKKFTTELPYDPATPLVGVYPKNLETLIHKTCALVRSLELQSQ